MKDRGMMKWNAYKSLDSQDSFIQRTLYKKGQKEKPLISKERSEKINNVLQNYHFGNIKIRYFFDGYIYVIDEPIIYIDKLNKKLILEDKEIPFSDILDLGEEELYITDI